MGFFAPSFGLLLFDNQPQTIPIENLRSEQSVFYISPEGSTEGVTIGPGKLALQIEAEKVSGLTALCSVSVQPIFFPPKISPILKMADHAKSKEVSFTCCRFTTRMSLGDFILLGTKEYVEHRTTLSGLLFSRPVQKPVIRIFMLVCTAVYD